MFSYPNRTRWRVVSARVSGPYRSRAAFRYREGAKWVFVALPRRREGHLDLPTKLGRMRAMVTYRLTAATDREAAEAIACAASACALQ